MLRRILVDGLERLASKAGVVVVPDWRACLLDGERHLKRLLTHYRVDCVFDVGANAGQFARGLRGPVGYQGRIISFEPNPLVLPKLIAAANGDPLWHVESFALGRTKGTAAFKAYDQSLLGSFLPLAQDDDHVPDDTSHRSIDVPVRTLADYLPEAKARFGFQRPYLKMDTQGFDLEVAKGAGDALNSFVGLQSEVAFHNIYQGAPTYQEAIGYYEQAGFALSRLVPIHELHFPDLVEMDAVMVNKAAR